MNNKVGIYFAYWQQSWSADYIPYIAKVNKLGFDVLEICPACLTDKSDGELTDLKKCFCDYGIEPTFCIGLGKEYDLASSNTNTVKRGQEYMKRLLDIGGKLGVKVFGGITYSCWPLDMSGDNLFNEKAFMKERSAKNLAPVLYCADDNDIDLCFEIVNRFEQIMLNTAEEGVEFVNMIGHKRAKLLLDTFHMNIEESDFASAIKCAGDKIGHFHIGETNRTTPGTGKMDWNAIFGALKEINYGGRIVMEPFVMPGGQVGKDIKVWRSLCDNCDEQNLDEMAAKACAFVKNF